jgi:hypothetical protein
VKWTGFSPNDAYGTPETSEAKEREKNEGNNEREGTTERTVKRLSNDAARAQGAACALLAQSKDRSIKCRRFEDPSIEESIRVQVSTIEASSIKHPSIEASGSKHQVSSIEASGSKHQVSSIEASGSSIQASSIQASKHQGPSIKYQVSKHQGPASKHQASSIEASGSKHQGPSIKYRSIKYRSIKYRSIEGSKHQVIPPCSTSAPCPLHERVPRRVRTYVLDDRPTDRPTDPLFRWPLRASLLLLKCCRTVRDGRRTDPVYG